MKYREERWKINDRGPVREDKRACARLNTLVNAAKQSRKRTVEDRLLECNEFKYPKRLRDLMNRVTVEHGVLIH